MLITFIHNTHTDTLNYNDVLLYNTHPDEYKIFMCGKRLKGNLKHFW